MALRGDFPWLAEWILPVGTEERAECAELEPAGIELAPLLLIGILDSGTVVDLLTCHKTILDAESSDVHGPIRHAADRKVKACRDLGLHVFPTRRDITAPCSCRISLKSGKAAAGKQEDALVIVRATLTVVYRIRIHDRICIEVLCRRSQSCRAAESLAVVHVGTVADIRLGSIHPPCIDAERIVMFVHLLPEKLTRSFCIGIIEAVEISLSDPVADTVLVRLVVHPSLVVELLVMLCIDIELRPHRYHHASSEVMDRIHHRLRIREPCRVEFMASPGILFPMAPVHHDIIYRYIPLSEALQSLDHLGRCLVSFTALPVSHGPFRHDLGLSGQRAVSADDFIHIFSGYEVPVHLLSHLAPPLMLCLLDRIHDIIHAESVV